MINNYLTVAFRNINKRKVISLLNIAGMSLGVAGGLLILHFVQDELSYDRFHINRDNIYRIRFDAYERGEEIFRSASTFPKVATVMKADFPEVKDATRLYLRHKGGVVSYEDIAFKEVNVFQAEQNFFSIFTFPLINGTARLDEPNTAIIESKLAYKYFGAQDPIGKRIKFGDREEYEITGVMESPQNSHLHISLLLSYPTLVRLWGTEFNDSWGWYDFHTYLLLDPKVDPLALESKFPTLINKYGSRPNESDFTKFILQPLTDIHLYSNLVQEADVNGNGDAVYSIMVIGFLIVVVAWINYVNLSTAVAIERAKEVAIRKSVGAEKKQLVGQFFIESVIINVIAILLALVFVYLGIPLFNNLADKKMTSGDVFFDRNFWYLTLLVFLTGTFLSGVYPAYVLSSYQPAKVLNGSIKVSGAGLFLRRTLIVGQFVASAILIATTMIVDSQLTFMQEKNLGVNLDQVLVVHAPGNVSSDSLYASHLQTFRNILGTYPPVEKITVTTEVPGNQIFWAIPAKRVGDDDSHRNQLYMVGTDFQFFSTFGNKFLAGRDYSKEFRGDNAGVIINKRSVEVFNLGTAEQALGQKIDLGEGNYGTRTIVGVIDNYHQEGLRQDFRPTAFVLVENARNYFCIKVKTASIKTTLQFLREKYESIFPDNPFDYFFLDSFFDNQYRNERQFRNVFFFFSSLTIFIAGLGLFGVVAFVVSKREKEIGIRKIFGSSGTSIFILLSKDFVKLVLVANIIALPIVWYTMGKWLETFAFRIPMPVEIFLITILVTSVVVIIIISFKAISVIRTNPILSLRDN